MLGTHNLGNRALVSTPRSPRPYKLAATTGELGWASWSFSRQAKLNSWSWHGLGGANVLSWAAMGSQVYLRRDTDNDIFVMQPDTFYSETETNAESKSVEAVTQWLDFGRAGKRKALNGIDFDGVNIQAIEIYVSENGGRTGTLAATIPVGDNDGGWTYNGEVIPLEEVGSATEFMLRIVGHPNLESAVNRLTIYWDEVAG
jgi:hypothetical protein